MLRRHVVNQGFGVTVLIVIACLAIGLALAALGLELTATNEAVAPPPPAKVLGPYPMQTVTNRVAGVEGPALRAGETTRITGELCSTRSVDVLTTITWQAVGHTGTFVTVGRDVPQHRDAGCHKFTFRNPMPPTVVMANGALRSDGTDPLWVVNGYEVPAAGGQRETFTSDPFHIVP